MTPVIYLHGFASSPQSSKASFFGRKLRDLGVPVQIPQLDRGDFENLTVTGQLAVIEQAAEGEPAVLMGSSLGGYLAALYASRHEEVERMVLLAPAFQFPRRLRERYAADLERWEAEGSMPVYHYGYQDEIPLRYEFLRDASRYEEEPEFSQPALVIHGRADTVVPSSVSEQFAARHPNVNLHLLESGHELTDVLEPMWVSVRAFLEL